MFIILGGFINLNCEDRPLIWPKGFILGRMLAPSGHPLYSEGGLLIRGSGYSLLPCGQNVHDFLSVT